MVESGKIREARAACEGWLKTRKDSPSLAEARKCLANVELADAQSIRLGKEQLTAGFGGPAVDRALQQLGLALALSPADLSIHQGRLHVLLRSGRFGELDAALQDSLKRLGKKTSLNPWLPYADELRQLGEVEAALSFSQILAKRFPRDHRSIGNVAAFLAELRRDDEAIGYAQRAVALAPHDPIDLWNLGALYEHKGKLAQADSAYRRSLASEKNADARADRECRYASFLETKRGKRQTACELQKKSCPTDRRSACSTQ